MKSNILVDDFILDLNKIYYLGSGEYAHEDQKKYLFKITQINKIDINNIDINLTFLEL